jgi:hypothetical protein
MANRGSRYRGGGAAGGDVLQRKAGTPGKMTRVQRAYGGLPRHAPGGENGAAAEVQRTIARPTPVQLMKSGPGGGSGGGGAGSAWAAEPAGAGAEGASGAAPAETPAVDPKTAKVARLYFLVDVDVKDLGLEDLRQGNVGHTWISLEYIDPHAVPDSVHANHRGLLQNAGRYADPMGFWPDTQNNVYYSTNLFKSYVQGWMRHPDRAHEGAEKAVQVWELTQEEVEQVIAYAESKRGAQYSVYFFNCTTFAKEATEAAGKSPPSSSKLGICFPNAAYDGIVKRQAREQGHTMVTDLDTSDTTEVDGADGKR